MPEVPCDGWVPNIDLCSDWTTAGHSAATQAYALRFASYVIWAATGRRFGLCAVTVRPCRPVQAPLYLTYPAWSIWDTAVPGGGLPQGPYAQPGTCCGSGPCQCSPSQIALPGPVGAVTSVQQDGVTVDPAGYRLVGNLLVRQGGEAWPLQQDLASPLGDVGTFGITYTRGEAVPDVLNDAAGVYACEVAKARTGGPCALPGRVQSISRGGVDIEYVDTANYLDKGWTGVQEVDQIIATINPYGLKARPRVVSPDLASYH
jgi:hypothetical protein